MNTTTRSTAKIVVKVILSILARYLLARVIYAAIEAVSKEQEERAEQERLARQHDVNLVCDLLDDDPQVRRTARIALGRPADEEESLRQSISWAESLGGTVHLGRPDTRGMTSVPLDEV